MVWLHNLIARYDRAIWIRVIGTILTTFAGFMLRPFLAFYLYDRMDGNLLLAAMVTSLQPLTSIISGYFAGSLSDKYGRKPLMIAALLIESVSMAGYMWAESLFAFAALTILNGVGASLFWPAASAQVTDIVPEEKRSEVFALLHTALNLGAAAGPLIGVALYKINPGIAFGICSLALFIYCLLIAWQVPETLPKEARAGAKSSKEESNTSPRFVWSEHKTLFWMALAAVPLSLLYSQVEIILPQHLRTKYDDFLTIFATLLTINGILVVCCQIAIAKFAERFPAHRVILTAYLFLACVGFGYGWAPGMIVLILAETMFTIGEMLYGPQIQKAISVMAPDEFRGRYFAVFGANWGITGTIGPTVGALAFRNFGGAYWFSTLSVLLLIGGMFQYRFVKKAIRHTKSTPASAEEPAISGS
ncbi:MFS transporter [Brevibacillus centrosporus]|uniref:MDR family MFS transporter n=1 Tax=Brevibacillus centrosporus TaxID=54910 RepID=UPI000F0A0FED|nr:MFS transporter [Brevibacillus centrosporus]MEC2129015.1 MFS transporter [Brevibacillus centrosporus]RNB70622.1 MFS transporter [Brevibacillus centrosporus]GED29243.1 MFS transporter [Brevibacillus centrosporus]